MVGLMCVENLFPLIPFEIIIPLAGFTMTEAQLSLVGCSPEHAGLRRLLGGLGKARHLLGEEVGEDGGARAGGDRTLARIGWAAG